MQRFLIERRLTSEDNRDRLELRNWFRASSARFARIEHVAKTDPLAWGSDAMSGIWSDLVLGRGGRHLDSLVASGTLRSAWQDWE